MKGTAFRVGLLLGAVSAAALLMGGHPAAADESPFGDAVQVADAQLDNLRGGFEDRGQVTARFGIELSAWVNGKNVGDIHIGDNGSGHISGNGSSFNFGGGNNTEAVVQNGSHGMTVVVPTTTTLSDHILTVPGTIIQALQTPTAVGTLIQNTQSNVSIQTVRTINIDVSGVLGQLHDIARSAAITRSIRGSLH